MISGTLSLGKVIIWNLEFRKGDVRNLEFRKGNNWNLEFKSGHDFVVSYLYLVVLEAWS